MNKSDLKTGMVIKTVENKNYLVIRDFEFGGYRDVCISKNGFMLLNYYTEDLRSTARLDLNNDFNNYFKIIDILEPHGAYSIWQFFTDDLTYWKSVYKSNDELEILKEELLKTQDKLNHLKLKVHQMEFNKDKFIG
jgi:hypothetical protein